MNLKKLEITGFKSFADPTILPFNEGITSIVGPNGCGKSNIADSIRWVLGEQSSKNLRGTSMQDVIFKGTEKRKGMAFCEVSLCFDNSNKIFNSPYEEIEITRKLYKNGESEYRINKEICRLKEITEMLHNSGVGKNGYSIIGQGMVGKIVNSKPEERRVIFEEAAGVAGFKAKKVEAERKLERTKINLDTINNVISEIDRQLKPLKHQSEVAKQYLELRDQLKQLEINAYIYQYDNASDNKAIINEKINAIVKELNQKQTELDNAMNDYNASFEKGNNLDSLIKEVGETILELSVGIEKQSSESNLLKEKLNNLISENDRITKDINFIETNLASLNETLQNKYSSKKLKQDELENLKTNVEELTEKFNKISDELKSGENEALDTQRKLFESLNKLSDVKAKKSALLAEKKSYEDSVNDGSIQLNQLNEKFDEIKKLSDSSQLILEKLQNEKVTTESNLNSLISSQNSKLGIVKGLEQNISEITSNVLSLENRQNILSELIKDNEGFNGSVKRLLNDTKINSGLKSKLIGVVASLINVPEMYQTAIEMALGNAVQNIITETEEQAKFLVNYLKEKQYGRITFLPINTIKSRQFDPKFSHLLNSAGCFGIAKDLIKYDKSIDNAISSLLGTTVVVNNINTAVNLAKQSGYSFRIVTLDGDIISPQGSITGGSKKSQVSNLLGRENEIENIKKNIAKLNSEKLSKQDSLKSAMANYESITNEIKETTEALHQLEIEYAKDVEIHNKHKFNLNEIEGLINKTNSDIAKYSQILNGIENELNKISDVDYNVSEETLDKNANQFNSLKETKDEYNQKLTHAKIQIATVQSELIAIEQDIDRLNFELKQLNNNLGHSKELKAENDNILSQFTRSKDELESNSKYSEVQAQLKEAKAKRDELEKEKTTIQSRLLFLDDEKMRLSTEVNKLQDKKNQQEMNLIKIDTDIETMQEKIWEDYELTYNSALPFKLEMFDVKSGLQEISKIKKQITLLGNINVNAIEDYQNLLDRHGVMYEQAQDLIKAEQDIKTIIKDLSDEMVNRFVTEFNKINENFGIIFKELFGGGNARLEITDKNNILESGVEIYAEPPEKKLKNTQLLSGGEQALVAIAILFAILRLKPMPFCLLDEIEAPLDEANVYRFVQYLKKYSGDTQFIVITHKKPTMEYSDVLYGITMEEKGVSKVVSVKLSDAVKMAEVK